MIDSSQLDDSALAYINKLIEEYERHLFNHIKSEDDEANVLVATFANMTNLETRVDMQLEVSKFQSQVNSANARNGKKPNNEAEDLEVDVEIPDYLECSIVDQNGKAVQDQKYLLVDFDKGEYGKQIEGLSNQEGVVAARNLTNRVDVKIRNSSVVKRMNDFIGVENGKLKGSNFDIDNCFQCELNNDINTIIPEVNYILDFRNLLEQAKSLMAFIKRELDPTLMISNICMMLKIFKENFLCPANLIGIQSLLPTLFASYSRDLLSLNLDFTILLGNVVKDISNVFIGVVDTLKLTILPYYDCLINVLKSLKGYIITIIESGARITDETIDLVNKTVETVQRPFQTFYSSSTINPLLGRQLDTSDKEAIERLLTYFKNNDIDYTSLENANPKQKKEFEALLKKYSLEAKKLGSNYNSTNAFNLNIDSIDKGNPYKNSFFTDKSKGRKNVLRNTNFTRRQDTNLFEDITNKYKVNLSDRYYRKEDKLIDYDGKAFRSDAYDLKGVSSIMKLLDTWIRNLEKGRKEGLDFIKKVNGTAAAIGSYTSESLDSAFRVNGEILNLIHLIRAGSVVLNLISLAGEDLSCEQIMDDPSKLDTLNSFFPDVDISLARDRSSLEVEDVLNKEVDPDAVNYARTITRNDCSDLNNIFDVNQNNLEEIYEGIAHGFFKKV